MNGSFQFERLSVACQNRGWQTLSTHQCTILMLGFRARARLLAALNATARRLGELRADTAVRLTGRALREGSFGPTDNVLHACVHEWNALMASSMVSASSSSRGDVAWRGTVYYVAHFSTCKALIAHWSQWIVQERKSSQKI